MLLKDRAAAARFLGLKNAAPIPGSRRGVGMGDFRAHPAALRRTCTRHGRRWAYGLPVPRLAESAQRLEPGRGRGLRRHVGSHRSAPAPQLELDAPARFAARADPDHRARSKWRTYAAACAAGAVEDMPVRAVLRQEPRAVDVIWAP